VNAGCTTFVSVEKDSHTKLSIAPSVLWCTDAHTHTQSRPRERISRFTSGVTEKMKLNVINKFKGSLTSRFDDVPELTVKRCF
jgi:hypothetical protein